MEPVEIRKGVFYLGAQHWSRRLFDELIPLPEGTSYNAYLVLGREKTALIDTADPALENELMEALERMGVEKIDYVVANHAEQDHSGALPSLLERYPMAKVVTNQRCKELLVDLLHISDDRFYVVGDGDTLSLGGKTLRFILAPWVHWPETMFTYLEEEKILFTCDFLGAHMASNRVYAHRDPLVYFSAKRYYAEIMMPFRQTIPNHLARIEELSPEMIAPSHGLIYDDPSFILEAYRDWTGPEVKNEVLVVYVSMHGSVRAAVEHLTDGLSKNGIPVKVFNLTVTDIGELAMALVDAATVIMATPTVLGGPHPSALYATYLMGVLNPKTKHLAVITSYEWGGRTVEILKGFLDRLKVEILGAIEIKGHPKKGDMEAIDRLVEVVVEKHRSLKAD